MTVWLDIVLGLVLLAYLVQGYRLGFIRSLGAIVGLIAGFVARAVIPGKQDMSILMTIVLGIVGSFVGGFLGYLLFQKDATDGFFQPAGIIGSIIGAIIVLLVYGFYMLGVVGAKSVGGGFTTERLARAFIHTLVPIALAYVAAHYLTLLLFQGQAVEFLASDPLGDGSDLFGTADSQIDYTLIGANATWYWQVGFVVAGPT